jgi:hypothetical protein
MIETIATIFLLTVGIVGLAAGMAATERIATINEQQSKLEVAIRQLSDWVRDSSCDATCFSVQHSSLPYIFCEHEQALTSGFDPYKADLTAAITSNVLTPSFGTTFTITQVLESPTTVNGVANDGGMLTQHPCGTGVGDWGVQEIYVTVCLSGSQGATTCSGASHSVSRVVWKSAAW